DAVARLPAASVASTKITFEPKLNATLAEYRPFVTVTGCPFTVTKVIVLSTVPLTVTVAELTSVGKASIVTAGGVESRVTVRLPDPWFPAASTATRLIVFALSTSETGISSDPSARTVAGIPATVKEAAPLTTPEMTAGSLFLRTPAEHLGPESAGAAGAGM